MKPLVIALGGNALLKTGQKGTIEEQMENLDKAMEHIAKLAKKYRIVLTHGNGPQVGNILLQQKTGIPMPLYACVAESQGQIGYMIQEVLYNKLHKMKIYKPIVTIITQVIVGKKDSAFKKPTKPIGPFYKSKSGLPRDWKMEKTSKGFRRLVFSPKPLWILEAKEINKISNGAIVIACGGGGIPVVDSNGFKGIDAVIDKDFTSEKLATSLGAKKLVISTDVDGVYLNFGKKNQSMITEMNIKKAKQYLKQGQFSPGSMEPKIQAAIQFIENGGKEVIITSFNSIEMALSGNAGTRVVK